METSSIDETSRAVMQYVLKVWPSEKEQVDELLESTGVLRKSVEDGLLFKSGWNSRPKITEG